MTLLELLSEVLSKLDGLNIPYMVVGSFASSRYTVTRYTEDIDLLVRLERSTVERFCQTFIRDFYLDRELVNQAVLRGTSFNIIHVETTIKLDFFVSRSRYNEEGLSRRVKQQLDPESGFAIYLQSPEDTVLSKLVWFRQGGEISEKQWGDITGVLKSQAAMLDSTYMQKWAAELGVSDLLARAQAEVNPM